MGNYAWIDGRYSSAIEHAREALRLADLINDPEVRVNASNILGLTHLALGEYSTAIERLQRNVEGPDAIVARRRLGFTIAPYTFGCGLLAWAFAALGDFEPALAYGQRGIEAAQASRHEQAKVAACIYRATALALRGSV